MLHTRLALLLPATVPTFLAAGSGEPVDVLPITATPLPCRIQSITHVLALALYEEGGFSPALLSTCRGRGKRIHGISGLPARCAIQGKPLSAPRPPFGGPGKEEAVQGPGPVRP